ncbi:MAG TPA: glycosyltransferase [Bacteroidia bacterium]|nr:glycosyltransferase [Bacteroidia bacterium]
MMLVKGPVTDLLFLLLSIVAFIQFWVYWVTYRRLAFFKSTNPTQDTRAVSVIICAKNEVVNLRKNLQAVLEQAHPSFEVIVVNDCSWDESEEFLDEMAKKYAHLKIVNIKEQEKYRHGKKFALTLGVKAASNDILLMTDADCIPASKNWLTRMQSQFSGETEIVLGYGSYQKKPGFLNKLIRFDTFLIAMQYMGFALGGNAYMGVGRNLAYSKKLFFRNKGFAKHNHIFSGDDDLFVNENANRDNTKIEVDESAFTLSEPKTTFGSWFKQKRRHMSTGRHYKGVHQFQLFLISVSGLFFYLLLIALFSLRFEWRILVSLYLLLLLLKLPVLWKSAVRFHEKDLIFLFPILEPLHSFLQPVIYISNMFTKQKAWK